MVNLECLETLCGERVDLIPFEEKFISEEYLGWLLDKEVNRFLDVANITQTLDSVTSYVRSFAGKEDRFLFAIVCKRTNLHIGNITLQGIDWLHKFAWEGILIGRKDYWNKGFATESRSLLLSFAFFTLGLHRVLSGAFTSNAGGINSNCKLGYKTEGILRQHRLLDRKYQDVIIQGLIKEEFSPVT